uniref:Leucine zipper tumor suppressor 1 n=1 Tax=Tetraodon nigroviridis TaxID=99883 RepID=H3CWZ6_TETNG
MGSVSSVISGEGLNNDKHYQAPDYRLRKGTKPQRRSGGCSLDGLLNCGFTQGSSSNSHPSKGLSHSRSGRSEDFFYIKVSHKPRSVYHRGESMDNQIGGKARDAECDGRRQPSLLLMPGKMTEVTSTEKSLVRSAAFNPVISQGSSSTERGRSSLDSLLCPPRKSNLDNKQKHSAFSGTLSDSGRNSMSSVPTHSNSGSLNASSGPVSHSDGSSVPSNSLSKGLQPSLPSWVNSNAVSRDKSNGINSGRTTTANRIRSPITTDESLIECLEQRLLERETELQELQVSFEEKEEETCQLFDERQRACTREMEGLKQRCSTKLQQVSQIAAKTQQALQLQVSQLQAEKEKLQDEVSELSQEKGLVELRLRSYETEKTQLAPTLEEAQWEVCQKTGEISLLKQQLRDCQADINHKLNEIVGLRASLKENAAKMELLENQNREHAGQLHSRTIEVEVSQNELQRKKNEADLLREKVAKLEADIQEMKQDLSAAQEQRPQQMLKPEGREEKEEEDKAGHVCTDLLQREVEKLKQQLRVEKEARERLASSFEQERQTWNKEKGRVIKYQKQLQINYLQMHKKNQDLERVLKELTAELESRTELAADVNYISGLQTYDDIIATEI